MIFVSFLELNDLSLLDLSLEGTKIDYFIGNNILDLSFSFYFYSLSLGISNVITFKGESV